MVARCRSPCICAGREANCTRRLCSRRRMRVWSLPHRRPSSQLCRPRSKLRGRWRCAPRDVGSTPRGAFRGVRRGLCVRSARTSGFAGANVCRNGTCCPSRRAGDLERPTCSFGHDADSKLHLQRAAASFDVVDGTRSAGARRGKRSQGESIERTEWKTEEFADLLDRALHPDRMRRHAFSGSSSVACGRARWISCRSARPCRGQVAEDDR